MTTAIIPALKIGQEVKMINCPDAEIKPDRIWTIRAEPYFFQDEWRVLLKDYVGAFPLANVVAVIQKEVNSDVN